MNEARRMKRLEGYAVALVIVGAVGLVAIAVSEYVYLNALILILEATVLVLLAGAWNEITRLRSRASRKRHPML